MTPKLPDFFCFLVQNIRSIRNLKASPKIKLTISVEIGKTFKTMKRGIFFTCLILSVFFSVQLTAQDAINWLSVPEIEEKLKQEPRKILVKIYQED